MRNTYEKMSSQTWPNGGRKVAKSGEEGQEALVKLFWVKNFLQLVQTRCPRMGGSNYTQFCLPTFFFGCENDL